MQPSNHNSVLWALHVHIFTGKWLLFTITFSKAWHFLIFNIHMNELSYFYYFSSQTRRGPPSFVFKWGPSCRRSGAEHTFPGTGLNRDMEPSLGAQSGLVLEMWCLERGSSPGPPRPPSPLPRSYFGRAFVMPAFVAIHSSVRMCDVDVEEKRRTSLSTCVCVVAAFLHNLVLCICFPALTQWPQFISSPASMRKSVRCTKFVMRRLSPRSNVVITAQTLL